jgi:hypothetical protein
MPNKAYDEGGTRYGPVTLRNSEDSDVDLTFRGLKSSFSHAMLNVLARANTCRFYNSSASDARIASKGKVFLAGTASSPCAVHLASLQPIQHFRL